MPKVRWKYSRIEIMLDKLCFFLDFKRQERKLLYEKPIKTK